MTLLMNLLEIEVTRLHKNNARHRIIGMRDTFSTFHRRFGRTLVQTHDNSDA